MKKFTVNGKEYTLEYTIGASLYDDCVISVMNLLASAVMSQNEGDSKQAVADQLAVIGGVPKTALTVLYAGLLEHHGVGEYAGVSDESVPNMMAARSIAKDYIIEHKESGDGSWMDILNLCMECMGDDDFLTLIGVDKAIETAPTTMTKRRGRPKKIETIEE